MKSYAGSILEVNLTDGTVKKQELTDEWVKGYIGGPGFATLLLYRNLEPGINPFDPENLFICSTGTFCGTILPGTPKLCVSTKSPLTGLYTESYASGHWAPELKFAGYDLLLVRGASEKPVYLWIKDDDVEIRDASRFWGLKTYELWKPLLKEVGDPRAQILSIGPGGEKLIRYANVMVGKSAAGRGGTGAVAGSKKLKAVVVRGTKDLDVHDLEGCIEFTKECLRRVVEEKEMLSTIQHGTTNAPPRINELGLLGTRNWQEEYFEGANLISGEEMVKRRLRVADKSCFSCPLRCFKLHVVRSGPYAGASTEGPEYESEYALGSMCGTSSPEALIMADRLCDEYGIDTISAGVSIAFAMELYQRGLISADDTKGLKLTWGNHEAQIALLKKICEREGFGHLLGEGVRRAAEKIGGEAYKYAMHVKGQEIPGHSPRGVKTMALNYMVTPRGACHTDLPAPDYNDPEREKYQGKGTLVYEHHHETIFRNMTGNCRAPFGKPEMDQQLKAFRLVTGWDLNLEELRTITNRVYTLKRAFNVREGATRADDILPERFLTEPIPQGPAKGHYTPREAAESMLDEYYTAMGWDLKTGIPTEETLRKLNLEWVAEDLKKRSILV